MGLTLPEPPGARSVHAVHLTTVALLTPEELDEATRKTVDYRPPGT